MHPQITLPGRSTVLLTVRGEVDHTKEGQLDAAFMSAAEHHRDRADRHVLVAATCGLTIARRDVRCPGLKARETIRARPQTVTRKHPGGDRMAPRGGMTGSDRSQRTLLGIYLNDHLAGATAGVELARRAAEACRGSATGGALESLAGEIAEDRAALVQIMRALDVPVRHYKIYAAWLGEKIGRLKLNGHLRGRSPLSTLVELEALRLGVHGKAAGWATLRSLADDDPRLERQRLDQLLDRTRQQSQMLEELHVRTAAEIFGVQAMPPEARSLGDTA
jgi:hypothetical protein